MANNDNIIYAKFNHGREITTDSRSQYAYGQVLKISGLHLPASFDADISNKGDKQAKVVIGTDNELPIDDAFFLSGKDVIVMINVHAADKDGRTKYIIRIPVEKRPERADIELEPVEQDVISVAIATLNEAVEQTSASAESAENSANRAHESAVNAETSATSASNSEVLAQQYMERAETAAENAEQSETKAKTSEDNAKASETHAEQIATEIEQYTGRAETASTNAESSASIATQKATEASAFANIATTKANEASTSATNAQNSADNAQQSATDAQESANSASASASRALVNAEKTQNDKEIVELAKSNILSAVGEAQTYATTAQSASQAIQDMNVQATTLEVDSDVTVEKSVDPVTGVVTLTYGIPKGVKGEKGDTGSKGDKGDPFVYSDFTPEQLASLKGERGEQGIQGVQGEKGDAFTYADFTPEQLASLKGEKGDKGDQGIQGIQGERGIQGEQGIQGVKGDTGEKGDKGDAFEYSDFTPQQLASLKGEKGDKGDAFEYSDFTPEQLVSLKGEKGDTGNTGAKGDTGDSGVYVGTSAPTDEDVNVWINPDANNSDITIMVDPVPTQGSTNAVSSGGVYASLDEITEDYGSTGEDVTTPITLDVSDVNVGYRCGDNVGNSNGLIASSVTTCIKNAFTCEAGKEYILTITNGQTPAKIASRGTVVVFVNNKVAWSQSSTNTAEAEDIVEFTPEVSGSVWFNLDLNYTNVAVVTVEERAEAEKTAVDKTARADIETLQNTLAGVPEAVTLVQEEIDTLTGEVEQLTSTTASITETSIDGTVDNPVDIDLNDIHIGAYCNGSIGQSVGYNTSTATTCIAKAFECEAGKTYKITVTNSNTPASLAQRAIVIYGANDKVVWYTYYRSTANFKDVITFTPTESGFAYINVDKNYTAVSATVEAENIVITAVDAVARKGTKFILNGTVAKDVVFEEGAFDVTLADTVGTGYRSNVITGIDGCAVCIKVNPSYAFTYGDGVNALMSIYGIYVIHCISDSFRIGLSDTPENVGFEMRIYRERGHKGKYDVIVAANDSSDDDRAKADIICDGVNDELDLQFAVNWNYGRQARNQYQDMCNVLLMPGTYNIDDFTQQYTADGRIMRSKNAVVMGNHSALLSSVYSYRPTISGCYETEHGFYDSNVLINVTTSGINALDAELDNVIFGIPLDTDSETGAIRMNNLSVGVYNLCIFTNGINNKIICIDGYQAGNTVVKNCDIWSTKSTSGVSAAMIEAIPEGSIGIRAGRGSDLGVRQRIEGCRIHGYHEGIALCGEHFICEDNLEIRCYYGFTVNNYPSGGALQHPNVFIGNSIEQCYKMGKLGSGNNKTTLVYIGGSVEHAITNGNDEPVYMLPIDCLSDIKNRGRIESDGLGGEYANSFFYEGYGTNFVQTIYPYKQI